jgi:VIT1/CCC1 family predicted Fe2+/Mn2+ transporter
LVLTGVVSARISGSKVLAPTVRVLIGGCLGMAITAGIGQIANISGI